MLVFVYGSLKRGHGNHAFLETADAYFMGEYVTVEQAFDLVDLGSFPGLTKGNYFVKGELYELKDIRPIDRLEGHPSFYRRDQIMVQSVNVGPLIRVKAWSYFIGEGYGDAIEEESAQVKSWGG